MQRKKPRPTDGMVPVESLEAMQSEVEAVRLEGQAVKEEWQQMNRRMQDAQQRLAAVEARNVFLEKADEARRLIHTDLRDTQRRLVETRDEHRRIQQESATRQLDLEQQVQDLRMIQDEVGHLLRAERAEKERLAQGQATAQAAAAAAIARVGSLLEGKALAEEEAAALTEELEEERGKESSLDADLHELRVQLVEVQRENDAKIAELVNHLDIVMGAVASHGRTMVRHAGGVAQLGTVMEHECQREEPRRAALATADKRWASKAADFVADGTRAAAAARNRGRVAFQPFAEGSLYMRYKVAATEQLRGADKSEPIAVADAGSDGAPAAVPMDDEPTPWARRAVFPVSHTSPFWASVSPSPLASAGGTAVHSSLSSGAINTKPAAQASVLPAGGLVRRGHQQHGQGQGGGPGKRREAPRMWSEDAAPSTVTLPTRYGTNPWVDSNAQVSRAEPGARESEDLWADSMESTSETASAVRPEGTAGAKRALTQGGTESIVAAVEAAAASAEGNKVMQESEAALNARVQALQLENAQLELEFRQSNN